MSDERIVEREEVTMMTEINLTTIQGSFNGERIPYMLQMNGRECLRVNLDGSVTIASPLTPDEYAMLTAPENWNWGPQAKALIDGHSRQ